ncbi:transcriptional regulator with XRE-family HTH domain [Virgibacillus natechei]|uniref:Transcriptional regulator with XRE-family HTH domain n=1 Tax=Virgibacillus natechei TaxID=1216297 RepID=A0ABS4IL42_9BACI|nr:helix-turn-helix domain-containing protein [Virgibacillus natechei]MBP1971639.1 transcriptional regulator with XRE-family HTH domain [Virgibacillus natechei]UZD13035.1 helix-turn-helix domain-containing protein [Virgibacillus natechei]
MSDIGSLLKELRGKESLREASKRIGISHTYLDTIEKGHDKRSGKEVKPTPDTLKLIANAYHYSYDKLLVMAGYIEERESDDEKAAIMDKIANEFPDADLMFNDLAHMTAEQLEDVYEYIKFKQSKRGD